MNKENEPYTGPFPRFHAPGLSSGDKDARKERVSVSERKISSAESLLDLSKEFDLFTLGLVFLYVPLNFDLFGQFAYELNSEDAPFSIKLDDPVFSGMTAPNGDPTWNHVLFGYPRRADGGNTFLEWLGRSAFWDPSSSSMIQLRTQSFEIQDVLWRRKIVSMPETPQLVPVTAAILETSWGWYYFNTDGADKGRAPRVRFDKSDTTSAKAFAVALSQGKADPYAAISDQLRGGSNGFED